MDETTRHAMKPGDKLQIENRLPTTQGVTVLTEGKSAIAVSLPFAGALTITAGTDSLHVILEPNVSGAFGPRLLDQD